MLSSFNKSISLSILTLVLTSCASKTNGKYHTKYSYHPYYNLYAKKMSTPSPKQKEANAKSTQEKSKLSLNKNNRFPNNSSK